MGFRWMPDETGFWVEGPLDPATLASRTWFPPDAWVERHGREVQRMRWEAFVTGEPLHAGERARLPGNPTGVGPLLYVMDRLLGEDGCPWDREQTPRSLLRYLLEEAYEAAAAILADDAALLADELGDVLLQVAFQAALAARAGRFTFDQVVRDQAMKLVRRHPHVFAGQAVAGSEAVRERWEAQKALEPTKGTGDERVMPALLAADRAAKRGRRLSGDRWPVWQAKLAEAGAAGPRAAVLAEWLWAAVMQARAWHLDPEAVLWEAIQPTGKVL
jgi:NTP pyrophosphatase (non-canonical NTP hydrolase)